LFGARVRTCADLTDVPAGPPGQVNGWQEAGRAGEYDVIVRFEPVLTARPVIKWLSKSDFHSLALEAPRWRALDSGGAYLAERSQLCKLPG
jgi:hypothetical protein